MAEIAWHGMRRSNLGFHSFPHKGTFNIIRQYKVMFIGISKSLVFIYIVVSSRLLKSHANVLMQTTIEKAFVSLQ